MSFCIVCNTVTKRSSNKYCSNSCQARHMYITYIQKWKLGTVSGNRGKHTKNISAHIKRYLIENHGEQCSICGWNTIHKITHHIPLEIDHINGDSEDNSESNLRLLCPNCHSLSINYKNLNKGKGRKWRKHKYLKNSK